MLKKCLVYRRKTCMVAGVCVQLGSCIPCQTVFSQWPYDLVFGVHLNYACRLKSVSSDGENPEHHEEEEEKNINILSEKVAN